MYGLNHITVVGNLTGAPEIRYVSSGTAIGVFTVAINRKYKQGEHLREDVCFIECVAFGKTAEHCGKYLTKGSKVLVDGRIQQRRWEDENGARHSRHEIAVGNIMFLSPFNPKNQGVMPQENIPTTAPDNLYDDFSFD